MIGKCFILWGVNISQGVGIETFPSLVFSEVLLNYYCSTMKFDKHLSFGNPGFSFSFKLLHFLDMWPIELCEHFDFAL